MPIIKRYPNRKLYNTETKQYITLDGIAEIIREGEDIQVTEHATGEDITALTLTQIIYEQEKKRSGGLPSSLLTSIIQTSGEGFSAFQRALTASVNYWHQIDEEIRLRIQNLVKQGDLSEGEGVRLLDKLINQDTHSISIDLKEDQLKQILRDRQTPSRQDLQDLIDQLDSLSGKLEKYSEQD